MLVLLFDSLFSDIYHNYLYIFPHLLLLLATNSIVFHLSLYFSTNTLQCNWIISTLNFSSFSIYSFLFFNTKSSFTCHLSFLNTFTSTFFVFSTILTISLFLPLAIFIFSNISISDSFITTSAKLQIHSSLINFWFSLFFSMATF